MVRRALVVLASVFLFPSLNQAQVTLSVGTGSGYRGSDNNPVSLSLSNAGDQVRKVQVEVCDADNYLSVLRCDTTTRSQDGFTCGVINLAGGCSRLILNSPGGFINPGTGAIATIRFNVLSSAPAGQCRALTMQNIYVYDETGSLLSVTPVPGNFCFNNCTDTAQCQDGLYCNGTDGCSSGACTHTGDPCPGTQCNTCQEDTNTCFDPAGKLCTSDGLFCNGDEICNGSGSCAHEGSPCPYATCVEAEDLCTCYESGESCEDNKFCTQDDLCLFGVCEHYNDPCAAQGLQCDEAVDRCICQIDAQCSDSNDCTDDRCERDGSCRFINNSAPCDDGLFCNGADTCSCGICAHAGDPCAYPNVCYEDTNTCSAREVELTLGFGSGAIGTTDRLVNVQLKNPGKYVSGLQIQVCDENDYLIAASCAVIGDLDPYFDCSVNELADGCGNVVLSPNPQNRVPIAPSSTMRTIFNLGFDVAPCRLRGTACNDCGTDCYLPGETCSAGTANCYRYDRTKLCNCDENGCYSMEDPCAPVDTGDVWVTIEDLLVIDPFDNVLGALAVLTPFANFEVACDSNADCSRGSVCSTDTCSGGSCSHVPSGVVICNDGLYCSSGDRCSGGYCVGTGETCGSVFLCDEQANQCLSCTGDADCDGVLDAGDNCASIPNGPDGGFCTAGVNSGTACLEHCDCGLTNSYCSTGQEDSFPPGGNNLGDACDCEGNFDADTDVDGTDASRFKSDFGRSKIQNPCSNSSTCKGDFDCDVDVDGTDASLFKKDFGRSAIKNPCPTTVTPMWCTYP